MIAVDLAKSLRRRRTIGIAVVLGFLGILPMLIALGGRHGDGDGPPFFQLIRSNGLYVPLTALALTQAFFLPLMVALVAGDSIAGEASNGTLRALLVRPVPRTRLVGSKFVSASAQVVLFVSCVAVAGLVAGVAAFGAHAVPSLSGQTIGVASVLVRILASVAFISFGMVGFAALGLFVSSLTDSGPGATVVTIAIAIVSQILDSISAVRWIHPYLIVHRWLAFADLFRSPVEWGSIVNGIVVFAIYTAVFVAGALWWFNRKDIQS